MKCSSNSISFTLILASSQRAKHSIPTVENSKEWKGFILSIEIEIIHAINLKWANSLSVRGVRYWNYYFVSLFEKERKNVVTSKCVFKHSIFSKCPNNFVNKLHLSNNRVSCVCDVLNVMCHVSIYKENL